MINLRKYAFLISIATFTSIYIFVYQSFVITNLQLNYADSNFIPENQKQTELNPGRKLLVATVLASTHSYQFLLFLYPSWRYVTQLRDTQDFTCKYDEEHDSYGGSRYGLVTKIDMFIACEPDACRYVPGTCLPWGHMLNETESSLEQCYYFEILEPPSKYRFGNSINFLNSERFATIVNTGLYDYVMRTDVDAMLFPGIRYFIPTGDGMVGGGYSGEKFTHDMIEDYSHTYLNITKSFKIRNMQSTFYIESHKILNFSKFLVDTTRYFYDNAFTKEFCGKLETHNLTLKHKIEKAKICKWPNWHKGVSSLYGTAVAMNVALNNGSRTGRLDAMITNTNRLDMPSKKLIQAHFLHLKRSLIPLVKQQETYCQDLEGVYTARYNRSSTKSTGKLFKFMIAQNFTPEEIAGCESSVAQYIMTIFSKEMMKLCGIRKFSKSKKP